MDEGFDVALVVRLRPAALIVASRLLLGVVGERGEPPALQEIQLPLLPADQRHERTLPATHERHERREVEGPADLDFVGDGVRQCERRPEVVETGAEDGDAVRSVAIQLLGQIVRDALEVGLQSLACGVARRPRRCLAGLVEQRPDAGLHVTRRRRDARIEIDVNTDRTTVRGLEGRELPQAVPAHRRRHMPLSPTRTGTILSRCAC